MIHTQKWEPVCPRLRRVREKARSHPSESGASLAHYLDVSALHRSCKNASCSRTRRSLIVKAGSRWLRVTCLEEPDAVTQHVRICEGEIQ